MYRTAHAPQILISHHVLAQVHNSHQASPRTNFESSPESFLLPETKFCPSLLFKSLNSMAVRSQSYRQPWQPRAIWIRSQLIHPK